MKKLIWTVVIAFSLYGMMLLYNQVKLQKRDFHEVYHDCHKIWSARGLYGHGIEQNSLKSLKRAFDAGAPGAEIDLHYDAVMHRFILSHDHPKRDAKGKLVYTLKEGKLLTLEEVFRHFGDRYYFWIDYKNLGKLSSEETKDAIERLKEITKKNGIRERIYLEGVHPLKLADYTRAGFKTIFDIQPLPEKYHTASLVLNGYKVAFARGGFSAITMHYGDLDAPVYGEITKKILGKIPVFLYHVPDDKKLLKRLLANDQVRVILVGRDVSLNRFDLTACKK